jgi:peroxiredoxin Q/BCP
LSALRDAIERFAGKNAQVLGVSMDDIDTQKRFAESLKLPFPLAADPKGEAAQAFGVKGEKYASRATFVIGPEGSILKVLEGADAFDPAAAADACPLHHKG